MTEFRDLSKLPDDARYWENLEARIAADLRSRVRGASADRPGWWSPLAARAWGLGGLAAAALLAALVLSPGRPDPDTIAAGLLRLPDGDSALHALVLAPSPPSLASLMLPNADGAR